MTKRKQQIEDGGETMTKRSVLHIPSGEMLRGQTIKYWTERFQVTSRKDPTDIVLPAIDYVGPTFDSRVYPYSTRLGANNLLPNWIKQTREVLGNSLAIWAYIIPDYGFLQLETLMLQDQYDSHLSQICITNPTVQKITDVFLEEIIDFGVSGIVFDLTDIYPNSGSRAYKGIQNTCFCSYCLKQLELNEWRFKNRPFIGNNNISRFVLQLSETGADHIEAQHEWIADLDTTSLIQLSKARGFVGDEDSSVEDAEKLLRYFSARGKVTAQAVRRLSQVAREKNIATAVILGDEHFDMTQCTDLQSLVKEESISEYWLPAINSDNVQNITCLQYLYGRGGYGLKNFFEVISEADNTIAAIGAQGFIDRLVRATRTSRNNQLNPGAVLAVEFVDTYDGFVGVPISQNDFLQYIEGLTEGSLGQVVPEDVIETLIGQIRIVTPEKSR